MGITFVMGEKKAGLRGLLERKGTNDSLDVGLGLAKTDNAISRIPLTALFEQVQTFETFQNIALNDDTGRALEAFVL